MNEDRDQVNRLYNLKEETLMRKILLMLMSVILALSLFQMRMRIYTSAMK